MNDSSYTWGEMLPFFKKSCDFSPPSGKFGYPYDASAFGDGGPLKVSYTNYYQSISPYIEAAFRKLGFEELDGPNSGKLIGYAAIPYTIDEMQIRSSSETSFGQAAIWNTSTMIYHRTLAEQIVLDGNRAVGVEVVTDGRRYTVSARKEVIVSSGAVSVRFQTNVADIAVPITSIVDGVWHWAWTGY